MEQPQPRLIFVYNASSSVIEALIHAVHKQVRPETYPCSLCALTYGAVSMRGDWKAFWRTLPAEVVFHHSDDFAQSYPALGIGGEREVALPCVLLGEAGEEPRVIISDKELDAMADIDALMARVQAELGVRGEAASAA